jgi:hypothetical protein
MAQDDDVALVASLLSKHVSSPSLRHIRDGRMLHDVAREIVKRLLHRTSVWKKWEGEREAFIRTASICWIPTEDLRSFLNELPGPPLTQTDVAERLRAIHEEPYQPYPNDDVREGCLALYAMEKAAGTEMPAIAGALRAYVEQEEERLHHERQAAWKARLEMEKAALEQRYLSGADCKWTRINGSKPFYCRVNGRSYRLTPMSDKRLDLHRVSSLDDAGILVGRYARRGEVTKALAQVAYQPDLLM